MKKITLILMLVIGICGQSSAQQPGKNGAKSGSKSMTSVLRKHSLPTTTAVIFSDDCDSANTLSDLLNRGYDIYNQGTGGPGVADPFFQGNGAVFVAYNGPDSGYIAGNYQVVTGTNNIDSWLVLPPQNLAAGDSLAFFERAPSGQDPFYVDSMRVMYNPTNNANPADPNWVELGRFEVDTLDWARRSYGVPTASANGLFAIRYSVVDGGPSGANSNFVGIDAIVIYNNISSGNFDDCADAVDINSAFGGTVGTVNSVGPYDNSTATVGVSDPTAGWECFGEPTGSATAPELNNNVWFTFTGDGNNYFVESTDCGGTLGANYIDDGDTQFALYTGTSCSGLTPIKCNEDGPSATATLYPAGFSFGTTAGQTYYLMVDGFSFNGAVSSGQFCLAVSRIASVACTDPSVTLGTAVAADTTVCFGDTVRVTVTGAAAPNVGSFYGIGMIISNAPISGSTDPLNDPALVATYGFVDPVPATYTRTLVNDGTLIDGTTLPYGVYYWTPVVFGNATPNPGSPNPSPVFLSDLILDPACTNTGTSIAITVYASGDPACAQSVNEINASGFGIVNMYPVPVANKLNLDYNSNVKGNVVVSVKDQLGRVVVSENKAVNNGVNTLSFDLSTISSGIYVVTIENGIETFNGRFTKN